MAKKKKKKENLLEGLFPEAALDLCLFSLRDIAERLEDGRLNDRDTQLIFANLLRGDFGLW